MSCNECPFSFDANVFFAFWSLENAWDVLWISTESEAYIYFYIPSKHLLNKRNQPPWLIQTLVTELALQICFLSPLLLTGWAAPLLSHAKTCCRHNVFKLSLYSLPARLLIGWLLTMMSSLHGIRALTNSLGDTFEERQLNWGASERVKRAQSESRVESRTWNNECLCRNYLNGDISVLLFFILFFFFMGGRKQESCMWRFVLYFFIYFLFVFLYKQTLQAVVSIILQDIEF